ncbi:putative arylsulfatase activity regulator [Planctomycetales bacterium 10988]|nr:putative arylsulfatase activity regulator [Planctomycetales bacterium 10988]
MSHVASSSPQPATASTPTSALHIMTKPIGAICNLDCAYCYYLEKEQLYPRGERFRMADDLLANYIEQHFAAQPPHVQEIEFAWQGGEPTLLGLDFFRRVVELQKQLCPPGKSSRNSLQTNGTLLNEEWGAFLREHRFLVGLSIDGPADLHDPWRYDKGKRPTHAQVMRGWEVLKKYGVEHNLLTVVNAMNGSHPQRVYQFLKRHGGKYIQFIPIVERLEQNGPAVSERSVAPEQWGDFLMGVFEEWVRHDVGQIFVQIFDEALAAWLGHEPSLCIFRKQCGRALAMEHNGDLFSCDHFVRPEHKLGNIKELPILEMANSPQQQAFSEAKETTLPPDCLECDVRFICQGECPKNRFLPASNGEPTLNYLCAGYKKFFRHIDPYMKQMAIELRARRSPANVMLRLREQERQQKLKGKPHSTDAASTNSSTRPKRNDPCPCGSGKKFKACCLRRSR